jgi:hypothetical protein
MQKKVVGMRQRECVAHKVVGESVGVLTGCPPRDIPKVVSFGRGDVEIRNSKV